MTGESNTETLAVRHEDRVTVYVRFLDKATSSRRYRPVLIDADGAQTAIGPFADRHPKAIRDALTVLDRLGDGPNLLDMTSYDQSDALAGALQIYGDFFRAYHVGRLIVTRALDGADFALPDFRTLVPAFNTMLGLDLKDRILQVLDDWFDPALSVVSAPEFRDDPYTHGAGAMRALADMQHRYGTQTGEIAALEHAQRLRPDAGKGARLVRLYTEAGWTDAATDALARYQHAWPGDAGLAALADQLGDGTS